MASLYELTAELLAAFELASREAERSEGGELPPDFVAILSAIEGDHKTKLNGYGKIISSLEALGDSIKKESDRLAARAKVIGGNVDRLMSAVRESMEALGETKVETGQFRFSIVRNGQASLRVTDRDAIPVKYFKPVPLAEVDTIAIKSALKDGKAIDGVELIHGSHLRMS